MTLLSLFLKAVSDLDVHKKEQFILVDGQSLSISAVTAVARHGVSVKASDLESLKQSVKQSCNIIDQQSSAGQSIYGITTGVGASADTRTTNVLALRDSLLQHHNQCFIPNPAPTSILSLADPFSSMVMPESWVRGAMLIRMNALIRGPSGVRWELIEKLAALLQANIVPVVALRSSISASGDLTPLAQIAGLISANPYTKVFARASAPHSRHIVSAREALQTAGIEPLILMPKESLGIMNGTAFSASVASLALQEISRLMILGQVCTAMAVEALRGSRGSFDPFIHSVARPHPGQVEVAENIHKLLEGSQFAISPQEEGLKAKGTLRQDRYALRTAPQFLGPQVEDIIHAINVLVTECNSSTDNPLIDPVTGIIHNGGNFQAMAVTNAMEKSRLALCHVGKILFAQFTELLNPSMNNGLPPSLAATDPSLNMHAKGLDVSMAAYVSELGFLANPVSTNIQSAEGHNQSVNSLALISARATVTSSEIVALMVASYLCVLCQGLDLVTMQAEFLDKFTAQVIGALQILDPSLHSSDDLHSRLGKVVRDSFYSTTKMDAEDRMKNIAAACCATINDYVLKSTDYQTLDGPRALVKVPDFEVSVAKEGAQLLQDIRSTYLSGVDPTPASQYLGRTRKMYEFIRKDLGIELHGKENFKSFENGIGSEEPSIGQNIQQIHEALQDGRLDAVVVDMFSS